MAINAEITFDYIIVGAGSAGCVLAHRLSESGKNTVLLLEAGPKDDSFWIDLPVGFAKTYFHPRYNYRYYSEPEKAMAGRRLYVPRGKVQGGSGSINAMIYVRGQATDFDDWAAAGNPGWGYDEVLPFFKKLEKHPSGNTQYRSKEGLIGITPMKSSAHPLCKYFLDAAKELGYPITEDFNSSDFEGAGVYEANIDNGRRASSNSAYLKPALSRSNLHIIRNTAVQKIVFDNECRACAVQVADGAQVANYAARKEIILSAGAVDTPKLLMLSGVGDGAQLSSHQIPVRNELKAVGKNLQDHLCVSYFFRSTIPSLNDEFRSFTGKLKMGAQYLLNRSGPLSMSVNQAGGFLKGSDGQVNANIQLYFNPLSYQIPDDHKHKLVPDPYSGFLLAANSCRPTSRGHIELTSASFADAARIQPNYLSTDTDIIEAIQASRLMRKLTQARSLACVTESEITPGLEVSSDEQMLEFFRQNAGSVYHLCGSCAMGPDPSSSVVDGRLKVHGVSGLRVIDASVFPNITSGNINAAVMMVAEKGAAMILESGD